MAVVVVFLFLGPQILHAFRGRPASSDSAAAARLVRLSCEEVLALPADATLLVLPEGSLTATVREEPRQLSMAAGLPADLPPLPFFREWTIEAFRARRTSSGWERVPGGAAFDLKRVTVVIRDASPSGAGAWSPRGRGVAASVLLGAS